MIWPKVAEIYWDLEYNVPLLKPRHEDKNKIIKLNLTEPGDARPAFNRDLDKLREGIMNEFGDLKIFKEFFEGYFLLLNKVPHWDLMWEVVSSGNVLGQLYYDPFKDAWRFRLNSTGAYLAVRDNLVDYIIVNEKRVREKKVIRENYSSNSKQVVIVNKDMVPLGIAENVNGKLVVTKSFKSFISPVESSLKKADINQVLKHNDYGIYYFESRAKAFIYSMFAKTGKEVVVSYSGGKDSLTSLYLTIETLGKATLLFNDTGLELPETISNVNYVAEKYGLKTVIASAGNAFWNSVDIFGPPGKDYRWCCKIAKLVPLAKIARVKWSNGALNIVGQRAFESIDRAKSPRVWRNKWIPNLLSISPIQEWSQLHVWLYIYKYKLPYNKLYDQGFERLGCFMCPSSTLAEFKEVEKTYPDLWNKWISVLESWRKRLDQPIEWIKYGLWRWLTPARAKERIVVRLKDYEVKWINEYKNRLLHSKHGLAPLNIDIKDDMLEGKIIFSKKLIPEEAQLNFTSQLKMIKFNVVRYNNTWLIRSNKADILVEDNKLSYKLNSTEGFEDVADTIKIIYRIHCCAKCASCVIWCPHRLVKLTAYGPLPKVPCPGCRICLDVCPISDVLVERVVIPVILGVADAWRRPTRAYREDILSAFRSMGLIP